MTTHPTSAPTSTVPGYLRAIRLATAGLAAFAALLYLLIGFGVLQVVEVRPDDPSLLWFGLPAGVAFAFGAVVMLVSERTVLWVLGAVFQVFAISAYFGVAADREPAYEFWGIVLRVVQVLILVALAVLLARYPTPARTQAAARRRP
jgi:hypothetical protein